MKLLTATVISLSLLASALPSKSGRNRRGVRYSPDRANARFADNQYHAKRLCALAGRGQPKTSRVRCASILCSRRSLQQTRLAPTLHLSLVLESAWHTHPLGQILIVTAGVGRVQRWGGPIEEILRGDVVRIPPGQKHWHGASPKTAMTHIAIVEQLDGKSTDWMEKVSDEQYSAPGPVILTT